MDVYWFPFKWPGLEHLQLQDDGDTVRADSLLLARYDGQPLRLAYQLTCSPGWVLQRLVIENLDTGKVLDLARDEPGSWWETSGQLLDHLAGCVDVDIMLTPFTNTLPVRRLGLQPGESRQIKVAYVRLPSLEVEPMEQTYTCLETLPEGSRYRYESGDFQAVLTLDPNGLVVEYPGLWRQVTA